MKKTVKLVNTKQVATHSPMYDHQPNRWTFRCQANVAGERVAVRREAGKLFQMTGPATTKLIIPSVVVVLGTGSNHVRATVGLTGDSGACQTVVSQVSHSYSETLVMPH